MSIVDRTPVFDESLNPKYEGYDNAPYNPNNDHRGHLGTEDDIRMELWAKSILDKAKKFVIGEPPTEEPSVVPAVYFDDVNEVLVYIDADNNRTTYSLVGGSGGGDMYKSIYDTNNDGIVNSSHKELVSFINKTGSTLTKGTIVYLKSSSSSGTHPEALKANASSEATSSKTLGAIFTDVADNATGYIVTSGEVDNLDTSAYTIGTKLWLSTTDGQVTTTAPTAPDHAVFIGTVTRSQSTNGRILYAIQNGYELEELHNVSTTTYTSIQNTDTFLVKDVTNSLWKPSTRSNIKSVLKTYLDTLYQPLSTVLTNTTESFTTALKSTYDSTASSLTTLLATGSRLITLTEITKLGNTSGTNSGDVTVSDSSEIDFSLTGQNITASIVAGSIDESKLDASVNASLDLADSSVQPASTNTLTNKRITRRVSTNTSLTTSVTIDSDSFDKVVITAQAGALLFNNPSGTPTEGQILWISIKDNGTARALTYGAQFRSLQDTLPSTTVVSKWINMLFQWNSTDSKWDLLALNTQA